MELGSNRAQRGFRAIDADTQGFDETGGLGAITIGAESLGGCSGVWVDMSNGRSNGELPALGGVLVAHQPPDQLHATGVQVSSRFAGRRHRYAEYFYAMWLIAGTGDEFSYDDERCAGREW